MKCHCYLRELLKLHNTFQNMSTIRVGAKGPPQIFPHYSLYTHMIDINLTKTKKIGPPKLQDVSENFASPQSSKKVSVPPYSYIYIKYKKIILK